AALPISAVGGYATQLGVDVQAARRQSALAQHHHHRADGVVQVAGELVGVPAVLRIAAVGVDAAQQAGVGGHLQVVLEGVAGQRGVVGLDVELEVPVQVVPLQKADHGRDVE